MKGRKPLTDQLKRLAKKRNLISYHLNLKYPGIYFTNETHI